MFRLWTPDGYLHIASPSHLKELNGLGDDHLRVAFTDVVRLAYHWDPRGSNIVLMKT